jgi:bifunctional DNA-binding transcriptional regulator/antitoxin component of YhaV-PrlF toxin-antitoxin module
MQHCGMTTTLPVSKRGALTLPPNLRRKLGLDRLSSPMVIVEERDGGLFLQPAAAVPMRDIPKETIARWIARDEAEMAQFANTGKRKKR